MADDDKHDDEWTGSFKRPWMNPPMKNSVGATRGAWKWTMAVIAAAVIVIIVVLALVSSDVLPRAWGYALIPIALVTAFVARLLTVFKTGAEDKGA